MVVKRSEYQNQFKPSVLHTHQATYKENLTFRHDRRDREFMHTPICWDELNSVGSLKDSGDIKEVTIPEDDVVCPDSTSSNDEKVVNLNLNLKIPKAPEPQYQSVAEILEKARAKADLFKQKAGGKCDLIDLESEWSEVEKPNDNNNNIQFQGVKLSEDNLIDGNKDIGDKLLSIEEIVENDQCKLNDGESQNHIISKSENVELNKQAELKEVPLKIDDSSNLRCKASVKKRPSKKSAGSAKKSSKKIEPSVPTLLLQSRLKRPDRQISVPRAKCVADVQDDLSFRPPFISYGVADIENNLALHRTHNVRASNDVYGSALKAKLRREEERRQYKDQRALAQLNKAALLAKLSAASPREAFDWRSEYQKQFPSYEVKDYERAVSARAVIPRAQPLQAVHRGGCMFVQVE